MEPLDDEDPTTVEDEKFDLIYPAQIRQLSAVFWTPVRIAAAAVELLVSSTGLRVLDVGCGPGKFCLIGASLTEGCFIGIDQRLDLVRVAQQAAARLQLTGVEFYQGNVLDLEFSNYDAFYIFNPFEENMLRGHKIDTSVPLGPELFRRYVSYVRLQLGMRPIGTRVVTYMGYGDEVPSCFTCERTLFGDDLKLWIKTREYDADVESLGSYRGSAGWEPPRRS